MNRISPSGYLIASKSAAFPKMRLIRPYACAFLFAFITLIGSVKLGAQQGSKSPIVVRSPIAREQSVARITSAGAPDDAGTSITVTPSSGTGSTQTFVFTYSSTNQVQEHLVFNSSQTGNGSCYLLYDQPSNTLNVANDQGIAVSQSATPGGDGVLSNSQCSVPASSAFVWISGDTVNLSVTITFSSSFAGAQNIYASIVDGSYTPGNWQQIGTWTVPTIGGNSITMSPSSGTGTTQAFTFSYTAVSQAQEHLFFNTSQNGSGSCYLIYDQPSNTLNIADDGGTLVSQTVTPGGPGVLSNNQCSVPASSAFVWVSGNTVNLNVTVTFHSSFSGNQNIYGNIVDASYTPGNWQQIGTWNVPGQPQHSVSLNWIASISPNVFGYYIYRSVTSGGPYERLNSSLDSATGYTDSTVQAGQQYFFVVTGVAGNGIESAFSNEVQVTIPYP